jgi:hypothetical protein
MTNQTPFGYRYQGNIWTIKLRFTQERFNELKISDWGIYRTTRSGHIIFEASVMIKSRGYNELKSKLGAGLVKNFENKIRREQKADYEQHLAEQASGMFGADCLPF